MKVNDNVNRPEGDEEEVVFDENEDAEDDEADIDAVSLVQEFEFCCFFWDLFWKKRIETLKIPRKLLWEFYGCESRCCKRSKK